MDENKEELRALFKMLENDGKITVNEINKITKKLGKINKAEGAKGQDYNLDSKQETMIEISGKFSQTKD